MAEGVITVDKNSNKIIIILPDRLLETTDLKVNDKVNIYKFDHWSLMVEKL